MAMKAKHWLLIACGAIALVGGGYLIGRFSEEKPHTSEESVPKTSPPTQSPVERAPEPTTDQVQLEVALIAYSPKGCQMDPTAMGCNLYPIPVVQITNRGETVELKKIAVNKRYEDVACILSIGRSLKSGDTWMSEGNATGEVANPMAEFARGLRGELVDFRKGCGDRIVFVDVDTDRGVKQFEFEAQ